MRRWPLLVLEFVALTVPLTWLWVAWAQDAYTGLIGTVGAPLLESLGVRSVPESPAVKRFVSYVPFLVLLAVTPGLGWRRRLVGGLVGCVAIFLCHLALVAIEALAHTGSRPTEDAFSTVFPAAMFADAFPFILWAIVSQRVLRDAFERGGVHGQGRA